MKKIALLFLITILVTGIQSCSKEENPIEELELLDKNGFYAKESSTLGQGSGEQCKVFVRYAPGTTDMDQEDFFLWARQNIFSQILARVDGGGCASVGEWYVPCDELELFFGPSKTGKTNVIDAEKVNSTSDGPGTMGFTVEFKAYSTEYYTCDQVPLYIGL